MGRALILSGMAVMLSGCGGVETSRLSSSATGAPAEYRLHYEYGAIDSYAILQAALAEKAMELCPAGYLKTREAAEGRGSFGAPRYVWDIRCAQ